jgi:hypothetical protein
MSPFTFFFLSANPSYIKIKSITKDHGNLKSNPVKAKNRKQQTQATALLTNPKGYKPTSAHTRNTSTI